MVTTLRDEIKQTKPFTSLQQEVELNIIRTSAVLQDEIEQFLRPYGVTGTQYNVLRILRGSEPNGLCRNELRDRMLTRMPDVTRLLDRMEDAGFVARTRENDDRRMVRTRITAEGLELLAEIDKLPPESHSKRFQNIDPQQLRTLIDVLTTIRQKV